MPCGWVEEKGANTRDGGLRGSYGPAFFLASTRDGLLLLGGEDCQSSGFPYTVFERAPPRR